MHFTATNKDETARQITRHRGYKKSHYEKVTEIIAFRRYQLKRTAL